MNYNARLWQKTGLILMALSSFFFIFGSFWYADMAIIPDDWGLRLQIGLTLGIPAAIILFIALWRPKIGSLIAVGISIPVFYFALLQLIGGDSDPRLSWSLVIITAVYLVGAILTTGNVSRQTE